MVTHHNRTYAMNERIRARATQFIEQETQFHLGFLPTEQSNPKSRSLEADFKVSAEKGVDCLQRIDRDVLVMLRKVLASPEYERLIAKSFESLANGGRIIFSGCGATGRLSILLESMWRKAIAETPALARYADSVESIMTGGDYALVRSVEFFEDYASFGRRQVQEAGMNSKDTLVAITEGGETSSVLGTVAEALDRGCAVFLLFNNPASLLAEHLERSRKAIEDPRVCVLDLYCGPMALAGSTRMQATTSEQMVAGAALETLFMKLIGKVPLDYVTAFEKLLDSLESPESVKAIADYMRFEASIYANHGKLTYFADDFLLDIFTDTTERSPTFMLPPFRRCDDKKSPAPWTFVKNPLLDTADAWRKGQNRSHRCLNWTRRDYEEMGAADKILSNIPRLSSEDLMCFRIGREDVDERCDSGKDAAVLVTIGTPSASLASAFGTLAPKFAFTRHLLLASGVPETATASGLSVCPVRVASEVEEGPLELMKHTAIKLVLNTVSTGTMALLGRITGNWMSWVDCTNKKLMDRGTRLLVELAEVDYRTACETLFEAMEAVDGAKGEKPSPVQLALAWLRRKNTLVTDLKRFLARSAGWEMELGQGKGDLSVLRPAEMKHYDSVVTAEGATQVWTGHPELGEAFTVKVTWIRLDEENHIEGRLQFSGYQGRDFIERIYFPIVTADCDVSSYALRNSSFLVPTSDMRPYEKCFFSLRSTKFLPLFNTHGQSCYMDFRDSRGYYKDSFIVWKPAEMAADLMGCFYLPLDGKISAEGGIPYPCTVKFFDGGWYEATQIYRPWALQQHWWTDQTTPNPLEDIGIWVWNRGLVKDAITPVERLQKALGPSVRVALDWYWWHNNPYDTDYPNFWPPREGEEVFKAAVKRLTDQGMYVQVYVNGVCWDHDGRNWNDGGAQGAVIHRDGTLHELAFNKYNHHRLVWMCGEAEAFHDKLSEVVGHLHASGLTGQYLDMIGNASYNLCHNPSHRHPKGGGTYSVEGFRKMVSRLIAENPNYAFTTETASEEYQDLFRGGIICAEASPERMGRIADTVPAFTAIYHGRFASFGNYALPDSITPWDPLWPDEDRWKNEKPWHRLYPDQFFIEMARPLIWGAQPMVCSLRNEHFDNPEFAELLQFILETARFYNANRDYLFHGRMLSPDGFTCATKEVSFLMRMIFTTEAKSAIITKRLPCILHGLWQNPKGETALFLANYTNEEQAWEYRGHKGTLPKHSYAKIAF